MTIHLVGVVLGFSLIFVIPFKFIWTISLPVCLVNVLLNLMSTFVLRYNIPKLEVALERAKRNQLKQKLIDSENIEENVG